MDGDSNRLNYNIFYKNNNYIYEIAFSRAKKYFLRE